VDPKLLVPLEVCAKVLQQQTGLLSTIRCHVPGFALSFGRLSPWIADVRGGYGWTGQETGSGFINLAPSILNYDWF
jgi:hypothetical protein